MKEIKIRMIHYLFLRVCKYTRKEITDIYY